LPYDFKDVGVLIVEASPAMQSLIKDVLRVFGVPGDNIRAAYSVDEGFESFQRYNQDLLVIDWLRQIDSGVNLTKKVRTDTSSPNRYVPIIMTAGSGHEEKVLRSRNAGISEYLIKPFSAGTLANRVSRVIENPRQFVVSEIYVGPDRRSKEEEFDGEERRQIPPSGF